MIKNAEEYSRIILFLQEKDSEVLMDKRGKYRLKIKSTHFLLIENLLYFKDEEGLHKRVFHKEQQDLMELEAKMFHRTNHYGVNRFEDACNQSYFKIPRDIIRRVVADCITCSQSQPLKTKENQVHIVANRPMERLMIDLIDMKSYKETNCGYTFILTAIDVYSKYAWAFPLKKKTGEEVAEKLETLFLSFTGPPMIIQSDNGKEFINKEMKLLSERFKISMKHSRPRHPQANGQIERLNQTLTRYLQKHIYDEESNNEMTEKIWIKHINTVVYNYNLAKHAATKKRPFRLLLQIPGRNTVTHNDKNVAIDEKLEPENESVVMKNSTPRPINVSSSEQLNEIEDFFSETNSSMCHSCSSEEIEWETSVSNEYLKRMDRHSLVHNSKYEIAIGDKVMVSIDFDNNTKTKKLKLSSFYSEIFEVIEILSNNRIKIKTKKGDEEIIHLSRVKVVNKYIGC